MEIRKARESDYDTIIRLLEGIAKLHHGGRPDLFCDSGAKFGRAELAEMCADPNFSLLVADDGGAVRGYCFCAIKEHAAHGVLTSYRSLWIDDLCVDAAFRRRGVASALIDGAKRLAAESGCARIELNVWDFNENAKAFYEREGFFTQRRIMELPIK